MTAACSSPAARRDRPRWERAALAAAALAAVAVLTGQGGDRTVTAEKFQLLGPDGKVRAQLYVSKRGAATLTLNSGQAMPRVLLTTSESGAPMVSLLDEANKLRAMIKLGADGNPVLALLGEDGKTAHVQLTGSPAGVICNDAAGEARAALVVNSKGGGCSLLKDAAGRAVKPGRPRAEAGGALPPDSATRCPICDEPRGAASPCPHCGMD